MKAIVYIIGFVLLLGCNTQNTPPANLLSKEKFEAVLHDIILLQAIENTDFAYINANNLDTKEVIFGKHQTDSLQFAQSNQYYSLNIDEYDNMLDRILEKIKQEYSNQNEAKPKN